MFYLTTRSTHFICGYMASDHLVKEENVLFNDTLNTFFLISGFMVLIIWLRKEMFYLTTHSTHFICGYMV